jgi:hypothetical protein
MADIFEEVEEGLRQERYMVMLRRYGPLALALMVAVILGVGGREAWSAIQNRALQRSSDAFVEAEASAAAGDYEAAIAQFSDIAQTGTLGYRALAKMQQAAAEVSAGALPEAARLYDEAAEDVSDPLLADLARLKAAYLIADTIDLSALEARLTPLMQQGAPYEVLARELLGAKAFAVGDYAKAREAYSYLTVSLEAPGGVQARAQAAIAAIDAAQAASAPPSTDEEG